MHRLVNMIFFSFIWMLFMVSCKKQKPAANDNNPPPAVYYWEFESTPVWTDEFSTDGVPDPGKWSYDVGGDGWGNNELQYYTNGLNASVSNGTLKITARKENYSGRNYTSARMVTKNKGDWRYGRFEIRARLPRGRGTWPAIWMLPTDQAYGGWPKSGEIDIMEHVGFDSNRVHITVHTEAYNHLLGTQKSANKLLDNALDSFHVYRVDWTWYGIQGYIDGEKIFEFSNGGTQQKWPFDQRFHLLMNIAVGGSWGGQQGVDDNAFPTVMEIDYVKVYRFVR